MRVLVTGANGFVGSHVVEALRELGYGVVALSRTPMPHFERRYVQVVVLDLLSPRAGEILHELNPNAIVHCAAGIPSKFHGEETQKIALENRQIDGVICSFARARNCRVVFLSSTSVYGMIRGVCGESSPVNPTGPYALEKYEAEKQFLELADTNVVLRLSAPYGFGQRSRNVIQLFIERAICDEPLYYFGSGSREQDFAAVQDVVSAVICAAQRENVGGVYNIAGGQPISMKNLAELVISCVPGCRSEYLSAGISDPQEDYRAAFDLSKVKKYLGWHPRIQLSDGIAEMVRLSKGIK